MITTSYGTWQNYIGNQNAHEIVANCLSGAPQEWREAMEAAGADKAIAAEIYDIVDAALPEGVWRSGEEFYGPIEGDRALHFLREVVDGIDMQEIVDRHDVDKQPEPQPFRRGTALMLNEQKRQIQKKIDSARAQLAKMPEGSTSHAAQRLRGQITDFPALIDDIDRLLAMMQQVGIQAPVL